MNEPKILDLKSFAQTFQFRGQLGGDSVEKKEREEVFAQVQRKADQSFRFYLGVLAALFALFLAVIAFTIILRNDLCNVSLGIILGGGGVLGVILKQMGDAWKNKSELDLFSILLNGLPESQLGVVLGLIAKSRTRSK